MMLLIFAVLSLIATIVCAVLIEGANMMSDAPGVRASHWPTLVGLAFTALLFAGWFWEW